MYFLNIIVIFPHTTYNITIHAIHYTSYGNKLRHLKLITHTTASYAIHTALLTVQKKKTKQKNT